MSTYIIYYTDKSDCSDGWEVYGGKKELAKALKWLHSKEVKASSIEIYKQGKNFENDNEDVIECYKRYWK